MNNGSHGNTATAFMKVTMANVVVTRRLTVVMLSRAMSAVVATVGVTLNLPKYS